MYKMGMDGSNKELITQDIDIQDWLYIYNGKIYYLSHQVETAIRMLDPETKEDSLVYTVKYNIPNWYINAADNIIYYKTIGCFYRLDVNTGKVKISPMEGTTDVAMYIIGNKVFYYQNERPYMMNLDGMDQRRVG